MESGEAQAAGSEAHSPLFQDKGPAGPFVWRLAEPEVCEPAFAPASLTQAQGHRQTYTPSQPD
ncbi:hypothetical protein I79_019996 [Cricetulus griseus]|uniref:Uncharacterized protein n=1 Tax=Cricetulus griseus TaxID=10029 RepID=G3I8W4_CRIGR|nr:hypothetical protein I79_019996 [Cricetulus griseus]